MIQWRLFKVKRLIKRIKTKNKVRKEEIKVIKVGKTNNL
jgi:hypothetical protein